MTPPISVALLVLALLASLAAMRLSGPIQGLSIVKPKHDPASLQAATDKLLAELTLPLRSNDAAASFATDRAGLRWVRANAADHEAFKNDLQQLPLVYYWYRQSPVTISWDGYIRSGYPQLATPGEARVRLHHDGRLISLTVVPPRQMPRARTKTPDWAPLFQAAGLERSAFEELEPSRNPPPFYADQRWAWSGTWPDRPDVRIRVEAASIDGYPVTFAIIPPWRGDKPHAPRHYHVFSTDFVLLGAIFLAPLVIVGIVARRNAQSGTADWRGATVFAVAYLIAQIAIWATRSHHTAVNVINSFSSQLGDPIVAAFALWVLYMGLEPLVRRHWPDVWVSWSRMIRGRVFDPLVGRDVLIGLSTAAVLTLLNVANWHLRRDGGPASVYLSDDTLRLGSPGVMVGQVVETLTESLLSSMGLLLVMLVLRIVLRWNALVVIVIAGAAWAMKLPNEDGTNLLPLLVYWLIWAGVTTRFGIIAGGVAWAGAQLLAVTSTDFGKWYTVDDTLTKDRDARRVRRAITADQCRTRHTHRSGSPPHQSASRRPCPSRP